MNSFNYTTVQSSSTVEIVEKKSKFIANMAHVKTEYEAIEFIKAIKKKHYDARHNVYAYIIGDGSIKKYSDDGEPSRTGGYPVLEMFVNEGVTDVVCVVTRYFGGILLGTGGLIRAYTLAAKNALNESGKKVMQWCDEFNVTVPYNLLSNLEYILKGKAETENKEFSTDVTLTIAVKQSDADTLIKTLNEQLSPNIKICKLPEPILK